MTWDLPPEERIVGGIIDRLGDPSRSAMLTPFVAPPTLIDIARRSGERVERIGGASVEFYTSLGWVRVYERRGLQPGEVMFDFAPKDPP